MARLKQPAETSTYHFHNENPRGLRSGDCVFRAIATLTGKSWDEVYDLLCEKGRDIKCPPNDTATYEKVLRDLGYVKMPSPKKADRRKYTASEFMKIFKGTAVAHVGGHHMTAFVKGKVWDIWNCSAGSVGNFWCSEQDAEEFRRKLIN